MCVAAETSLATSCAEEFLDPVPGFCDVRVSGTLGATIVVHPKTRRALRAMKARLWRAVEQMRYGTVAINHWSALGYAIMSALGRLSRRHAGRTAKRHRLGSQHIHARGRGKNGFRGTAYGMAETVLVSIAPQRRQGCLAGDGTLSPPVGLQIAEAILDGPAWIGRDGSS